MADELGKQVSSLWNRFRKNAGDAVSRQSAALVRGKIVAQDVMDGSGSVIVAAGHVIDDAVIERALAAERVPALVAAAAAAQTQDLRERLQGEYDRTPAGQDRRNLADSDEYIEARQYIRYVAAVEVTDIRGNVLVPAGKVIQDGDIRAVREAGQLAALIYSAQQSGPPSLTGDVVAPPSVPTNLPPRRRTATPLSESFDSDTET